MTRWGLVLVVGWLGACAQGPVRVHLDRATVPADLDADQVQVTLERAVRWWHGCGFDVAIDDGGAVAGFGAIDGDSSVSAQTTNEGGLRLERRERLWATDDQSCVADCADDYAERNPVATGSGVRCRRLFAGEYMRHELGHLLGLGHEPEDASVMQATSTICLSRYWSERCPSSTW